MFLGPLETPADSQCLQHERKNHQAVISLTPDDWKVSNSLLK